MLDAIYARLAAKIRSAVTSIVRNLAFIESDTGDQLETRLRNIEREIVRINSQMPHGAKERKSPP